MKRTTKTLVFMAVIFSLLALFAIAASAQAPLVAFLDSHSQNTQYAGPIFIGPVEKQTLYTITAEGTFSLWNAESWNYICAGIPEDAPIIESNPIPPHQIETGKVGLDAAFVWSYPTTSGSLCTPPNPRPVPYHHVGFQVSTDGGINWTTLDPIEQAMTAEHIYHYEVISSNTSNQFGFRILDGIPTDNYGQLKITVERVNNPPVVILKGPYYGSEGSPVAFDGSGSYDPEGDALTFSWTFGDGAAGTGDKPTHTYADNGTYDVCLTVTDSLGASSMVCTFANIINIAPTVLPIFVDQTRVPVGTTINANADFTDPGILDSHTAVWEWGDTTTSAGTVNETNGSGNVTGSHAYMKPGRYTIKLTVTDKDGDSGWNQYQYVVVYDPKDFITGGGWFMSPANACPDFCQGATGKVNLGFVAKYSRNLGVPSGSTEFQFSSARLNFHSTSYERLDIIGAWAQYQGTGTINGSGVYGFILTAIDGKLNKGGGGDLVRMKIWDTATGAVIYDSQMGADDAADPTMDLKGGSIVIHDK